MNFNLIGEMVTNDIGLTRSTLDVMDCPDLRAHLIVYEGMVNIQSIATHFHVTYYEQLIDNR